MDIPTKDELLGSIRAFLKRHDMKPTRFGRDVTGEPQLIDSIEKGRSVGHETLLKIADFIKSRDADAGFAAAVEAERDAA